MNPIKLWNLKIFLDLGVWDLETTYGLPGPSRRIKPYVQNRGSNFHKQTTIFSRIMRLIQWNHEISRNFLTLGSDTRKLHLGHLGPEDVSSHMSGTIAAIFTNMTSIYQESSDESNKIKKFQKISWPWGLGSGHYIWVTLAQKTYQAICPEP